MSTSFIEQGEKDLTEDDTFIIQGDYDLDLKLIKEIPFPYTDIINEFADVEIFLISIDSLLLELTAHKYCNWEIGGQTIVLAEQIERFLSGLEDLNAKFKLVLFSDFAFSFMHDNLLSFLHSFTIAFFLNSKWRDDVITFSNPLDINWLNYLHDLTPSFMLMSLDNANSTIFHNAPANLSRKLISIAIHLNLLSIPVVLLNSFVINFTSVMAYRMSVLPLAITNLESKIDLCWKSESADGYKIPERTNVEFLVQCKTIVGFWVNLIMELIKMEHDEEFEIFCASILLSSLVSERMGSKRRYFDNPNELKGPPLELHKYRRMVLKAVQDKLDQTNFVEIWNKQVQKKVSQEHPIKLHDIWDGRLIYAIYKCFKTNENILPFRLQDEFFECCKKCGFTISAAVDGQDSLLDPPLSPESPRKLLIDDCDIYSVSDELLQSFMPEFIEVIKRKGNELAIYKTDYEHSFRHHKKWQFNPLPDKFLKEEERPPTSDAKSFKRYMWRRQRLSNWFQLFSDSLEGGGGSLLIDFSRNPMLQPVLEEGKAKKGPIPKQIGRAKGADKKGGKEQLSKKDQIMKANKDVLIKQQVERDKIKINFATGVKANAITALEDVMKRLDLNESKALCMYEKVLRLVEIFAENVTSFENIDKKREGALTLVEALKECFVKYIEHLNDQQKDRINSIWTALGFTPPGNKKPDRQFNLEIDFIYYQLQYGGRLIDVVSNPVKDERVTGFMPDAWQREMLDAVDQDKSALIIAPTSAGKTFVSYYCIEKVLRRSSDEVVVYISPSKSLTNQVVGSIYARFRNKPMVGGRVLYGVMTSEYSDNCINCQVLVTTPECFEQMLLSQSEECQNFVSRIKYLILDEIHCLNDKSVASISQGHIWEHIFLLTRCPFLALSATVKNVKALQEWLQSAEDLKPISENPRVVQLITYDERWSELELGLQRLRQCPEKVSYKGENECFMRGSSVNSTYEDSEVISENGDIKTINSDDLESTAPSSLINSFIPDDIIQQFNQFGVYKIEKLKMFGIPSDQKLTARQVLQFYNLMAKVDPDVRDEFEPRAFFLKRLNINSSQSSPQIWINRNDLRYLENQLKDRFLNWLTTDTRKISEVFSHLEEEMHDEIEKRTKLYHMNNSALYNITPLMDHLKKNEMLPALCFNDDREMCENLAIRVFNELQKREDDYKKSSEFQRKYDFRAEEKAIKVAKRKRDEEERQARRKKEKRKDEEGNVERYDKSDETQDTDADQLMLKRIRLKEDLERFKLTGKWSDEALFGRVMDGLKGIASKESARKLMRLIERGIGFHHDGLGNRERSAVEVLFRRGFLGVVFSTSTLALGMNLPCKTVVFGIDTPKLTPLQFRQMSGRAGRRGYDSAGNVIFMSLPTSKIRRLLTASLATLRGNVPHTCSFTLRLLGFVNNQTEPSTSVLKEKTAKKQLSVSEADTTNVLIRRKAALTLLQAPFMLFTQKEHKNTEFLKKLLKALSFFNVQLLRKLQLLDEMSRFKGFAHLAAYLSNYEPGNLVFVKILQEGAFQRLIKRLESNGDSREEIKDCLVNILAHVFTRKPLPLYNDYDVDLDDAPVLHSLPEEIRQLIEDYNKEVDKLFVASLQLATETKPNDLLNPNIALTGKLDIEHIATEVSELVPVYNRDFIFDESLVPCVRLDSYDHRGTKIYRNSYAYDFWKVEISKIKQAREQLRTKNKLLVNEMWYLINDFVKLLESIADGLREISKSNDSLLEYFKELSVEYDEKFRKAFGMEQKRVRKAETTND